MDLDYIITYPPFIRYLH